MNDNRDTSDHVLKAMEVIRTWDVARVDLEISRYKSQIGNLNDAIKVLEVIREVVENRKPQVPTLGPADQKVSVYDAPPFSNWEPPLIPIVPITTAKPRGFIKPLDTKNKIHAFLTHNGPAAPRLIADSVDLIYSTVYSALQDKNHFTRNSDNTYSLRAK